MTSPEIDQLVTALTRTAAELTRPPMMRDHERTLHGIVAGAVRAVPVATHAGMTMLAADGALTSTAPTGPVAARLDQAQTVLGEGPCVVVTGADGAVDADGAPSAVVVHDLADDAEQVRWPRFAAEALRNRVHSVLSLPLGTHLGRSTSLNLYAEQPAAFDHTSLAAATLFAGHAALALRGAEHAARLGDALETRDVIGQAKGILMAQRRIDSEAAFAMLVEASQSANVKLRDVASWLVSDTVAGPVPAPRRAGGPERTAV